MAINMPQKQDSVARAASIAGTAASLMSGNPLGVAQGVMGAKNIAQQGQAQAQPQQSAIDRRLNQQTIPLEEKVAAFHAAERYLPELPEDVRYEVSPAIFQMGINIANEVKSQNQGVA